MTVLHERVRTKYVTPLLRMLGVRRDRASPVSRQIRARVQHLRAFRWKTNEPPTEPLVRVPPSRARFFTGSPQRDVTERRTFLDTKAGLDGSAYLPATLLSPLPNPPILIDIHIIPFSPSPHPQFNLFTFVNTRND